MKDMFLFILVKHTIKKTTLEMRVILKSKRESLCTGETIAAW
jgi:hypothetical protein